MTEVPRIRFLPRTPEQEARHQRLNAQSFARNNQNVPIYYMYSGDVPDNLARAGLDGIQDIVRASGQPRDIQVFGPKAQWRTGDFSTTNWYVHEAMSRTEANRDLGFGRQIDANKFFSLFYEEPFQSHPHWEVFLTNQDLWAGEANNNFVFGITQPTFPASVQSVRRLLGQFEGQAAELLTRRLIRHEVGHMFGLPGRNFRVERSLGLHCANICSMRQGLSINDWARQHNEEARARVQLCTDCTVELKSAVTRFVR